MRVAYRYEYEQESDNLVQEEADAYHSYSSASGTYCSLVTELNAGSAAAFSQVYQILFPKVYFLARRYVYEDVASDLTADAFCKLWTSEKNFTSLEKLKAYLQVSVRNACLDWLRHEKIKASKQADLLSTFDIVQDPVLEGNRQELLRDIRNAIERLPPQARKVFKLAYLDGQPEKQIAQILQISKNTVKSHKRQALQTLRSIFKAALLCFILLEIFFSASSSF